MGNRAVRGVRGALRNVANIGKIIQQVEDRKIEQKNNELIQQSNEIKLQALKQKQALIGYNNWAKEGHDIARKTSVADMNKFYNLKDHEERLGNWAKALKKSPERLKFDASNEYSLFKSNVEQAEAIVDQMSTAIAPLDDTGKMQALAKTIKSGFKTLTTQSQLDEYMKTNSANFQQLVKFTGAAKRIKAAERRAARDPYSIRVYDKLIARGVPEEKAWAAAFKGREELDDLDLGLEPEDKVKIKEGGDEGSALDSFLGVFGLKTK